MPKITLDDVYALGDLIPSDNYELVFGNIPGVSNSKGLTIKCLNTSYPGMSIEVMPVNVAAHVVTFTGRKMYPRKLQAQFIEDSTMATMTQLRTWMEYCTGSDSGAASGTKAQYAVQGILNIYNQQAVLIDTVTFDNLFPEEISDTAITGESTTMFQINVTFSYDRQVSSNVAVL